MVFAVVVFLTTGRVVGTTLVREETPFTDLSVPVGLLAAGVYFLAVGVVEELVFRGHLLVNVAEGSRLVLGKRRAVLLAAGVTAGLFDLLHAGNPAASATSTLVITLFGLLLAGAESSRFVNRYPNPTSRAVRRAEPTSLFHVE